MKFDFCIGNPPYQEEQSSLAEDTGKKNYAPSVYNDFMDEAFKIAEHVEMITPARFLFDAGSTPKEWNEKMLNDEHLKVLYYESDSDKVFPALSTPLKGGVAVTYRNANQNYGAIGIYTQYEELNSIKNKVTTHASFSSLSTVVTNRGSYRYSDVAYEKEPEEMKKTADRRIAPSAFERMPKLFTENKPDNEKEYIKILGNIKNERVMRWFNKEYLAEVNTLDAYKAIISKANGTGYFGEPLSSPIMCEKQVGFTETYIAIGYSKQKIEAQNTIKYIKTKFCRALLGILKVTQNISRDTWKYVPLQDFTENADIDWAKSIKEIDKQLYKKYNLTDEEIVFIENNVKEMA